MRPTRPPPPPTQQGSVASTVQALPRGARPSEVWRSAAFAILRLNPKECDSLGALFEDTDIQDERRVLILDLLAGAGTFEAQVVMRRVLALAIARRNNRTFATFVQRLGFVEQPDGATLRFLMSVYAESKNEPQDVRAACAYALGAAAGQAASSGDADAALRASDVLRRDLLGAGAPAEKASLLAALGNAGLPSDSAVLLRFSLDADPSVRAAAALSLRKLNGRDAKAQLLAMLADSNIKVAQSALVALAEQKLSDEEIDRLAELVLAGRTALGLDGRILRLLVAQRPRTSSTGRPSSVENALRLLLGRVEAAVEATNIKGGSGSGSGSGEHRFASPLPRTGEVAIPHAFPSAMTPTNIRASSVPPPAPAIHESGLVPRGPMPGSGEYAIHERLLALGLNPHANPSSVPPPPTRVSPGAVTGEQPARLPRAANGTLMRPSPNPAAVVRRK